LVNLTQIEMQSGLDGGSWHSHPALASGCRGARQRDNHLLFFYRPDVGPTQPAFDMRPVTTRYGERRKKVLTKKGRNNAAPFCVIH
jgi:hypothetical protein